MTPRGWWLFFGARGWVVRERVHPDCIMKQGLVGWRVMSLILLSKILVNEIMGRRCMRMYTDKMLRCFGLRGI